MVTARRARLFATAVATLALLTFFAGALAWRTTGGRWFVVQTPSMGQAAPVGTLLLTRPVNIAQVHVGEFITFRAPTSGEVFSHRVVAVTPQGLSTRGDINGITDPWTLTGKDLIGTVVARWWLCGWLLRALPAYALLLSVVWFASSFLRAAWRSPARLIGNSIAGGLVNFWLHPLVGLIKLGATLHGRHLGVRTVSTGVLPLRITDLKGGPALRLVDGQVGTVTILHRTRGGGFNVSTSIALTFWWWVGVVLVCLLPLLWSTIIGLAGTEAAPAWDVLAAEQPISDPGAAAIWRPRPYYRPRPQPRPLPRRVGTPADEPEGHYVDFRHPTDLLWLT